MKFTLFGNEYKINTLALASTFLSGLTYGLGVITAMGIAIILAKVTGLL